MSQVKNLTVKSIKRTGRKGIFEIDFKEKGVSPFYLKEKEVHKYRKGDRVKVTRGRLSRLTK